mmetsp:Transcript_68453/g.211684  ORF Transcript_68453/g.211684 Transcript_68453/m.211684 type:complete len:272 (-) Transcript_68453:580-1395(-)
MRAGEGLLVPLQRPGALRRADAQRQGPAVRHADAEGLGGLAGRRAAAVGELGADNHRHPPLLEPLEVVVDGEDRRLGVQAVGDPVEHEDVHASVDEALDLLVVGLDHLAPVGAGRLGQHARRRPEDARHEAGPLRLLLGDVRGRLLGELRGGLVHLVDELAHLVHLLAQGVAAEGVGPHDVRPGLQVLLVDVPDETRLREHQQLIVPLQRHGRPRGARLLEVLEALAAVVRLAQLLLRKARAQAAIQQADPLRQLPVEVLDDVVRADRPLR